MEVEEIMRIIDTGHGEELESLDKEMFRDGRISSVADLRFAINVPDGSKMLVDVEIQS